ncbi:MAG: glycosyltransferase family 4 protein [Bacteroidia bacterium]|nr:glycosyltransferase family 4 protein [Bacteroidia bacterium]
MNVLHLNDKTTVLGGVEVYLEQLQALQPEGGLTSWWMGINKETGQYRVQIFPEKQTLETGDLEQTETFIRNFTDTHRIDLINIHSISDPELIRRCFSLRPVVRSLHEPRMFCPGHGKFWRFSEKICDQPFGLHCFYHAYKEGCTNRHPKRLFSAYRNTAFEIQEAAASYQAIIVMSEYIKQEAILAGIPSEKVVVNPYFTPFVPETELQQTPDTRNLLFLGRLIRHKGPHLMLKAALPILKNRPDVFLEIAGEGPEEENLKSLAREAGVEKQVKFHGWQGREFVQVLLKRAYIVIFPSIYPEAFGIVGIEAMMYAKPVVAFDVGGVATWLDDGQTGFLVPGGNWQEMKQAIERLLENNNLHHQMAKEARTQALAAYLPPVHLQKLTGIYQHVLSQTLKPER